MYYKKIGEKKYNYIFNKYLNNFAKSQYLKNMNYINTLNNKLIKNYLKINERFVMGRI